MGRVPDPSELAVRQRLRALTRSLPAAEKGDAARLHEARIATRRLREAVLLVARGSRARRLERTIRRLTRALGPVRELDVALQSLDGMGETAEIPRAAIRALRQSIREERYRLRAEMSRRIETVNVEKLRKRAIATARKHRHRGRDSKGLAKSHLRVAVRAARLRVAIDNAAGIYLPDRLHDVRVAGKKLRYAMEIVNELTGSRATADIRTLKTAQDLLGHMHDFEMLIVRVRALQASSGASNLRLSAGLDRLVRLIEAKCRELHGQYMAMRPKLFGICDRLVDVRTTSRRMARAGSAA
jgi:CHAD domain-containing protein